MKNEKQPPKFPNKYLVIGIFILITGGLFLLWTHGYLPTFQALWPVPIILLGLFLLYIVFLQKRREVYSIFGMILSLGGIFLLLVNTVISEKNLIKFWPAFMLITGISFIPYAARQKKEKYKIAIIIPAITLMILSCIFFLFSLNIMELSFQKFVSIWWPALIVIMGISFIIQYILSMGKKTKKEQ